MSTVAQGPLEGPQTRCRGQVVEGKYQPYQGRSGPREEDIIRLATFEDYEDKIDWALRGNRPSVPLWPPRPIDRSENF
jgi:hypothetical protein